ncbi:MAG: phosphotransferase, partial [Patescibacteria group bacterium]
ASYADTYNIFARLNQAEKTQLASLCRRYLIHGDAHPENVIRISKNKIGLIDFTDMCLADFARDLGTFLQQLEYMAGKFIAAQNIINEFKQIFLNEYIKAAKIKLTADLQQRIATYYYWTALRTAVYLLVSQHPEPEQATILINKIKTELSV